MRWDINGKPLEARTAEELEQIRTPNGIRQRIFEASYHDPLVRQVFNLAAREGLSAGASFTLLTYHAIVQKQRLEQMLIDDYNTRPPAPIFIPASGPAKDTRHE